VRPIVRAGKPELRRQARMAGALVGAGTLAAVALLVGISAAAAATAKAALHTPPTFTHVSGSPNPLRPRRQFKITARECDRVADVDATGTMTFVDVSTGVKLGTVALSPSPKYVNCGQAVVTDHEKLFRPGRYKIRASYKPGGRIPVHRSTPAHYYESVRKGAGLG
jgi:hypothetical protein